MLPEPLSTLPPAAAFGAVLAQMADGVIVADAAGRITYVNAAARRLHGGAGAVGVPLEAWSEAYRLYTMDGAPHPPHALPLARAVGGEVVVDARWRVRRPDGSEIVAQGSATPLRGPGGEAAGAVLVLRDATAEHAARAAAEAANRAKSHFLATTSHEIRTPLNAIMGYTELLELGIPGPLTETQRGYLERVRLSSRHLLGVVNQVLDLSKIEAGRMVVRVRPARAGDAAEAAAALVESQAQARGVALTGACPRSSGVAYLGDPDRVEQILVNLLSNATKFTEPGGSVTLTCGLARVPAPEAVVEPHERGWAYFRVEDTGVGIRPDQLAAIFEPFVQAEQGHTRTHGGTGLGLAIARRLARMMGGDVTVRSAPGEGSTFMVWLAAARPEDVPEGAAPAAERRGRGRHARGLAVVADAALEEIERVLSGYAARLRTDPGTPSARALSEADLEDHTATFLADMAQALAAIEEAGGGPSAHLRDGTLIQRVIAERHGAQRARLGWGEAEVRREFEVLREELAAAVRRRVRETADVEVGAALALFGRFIDHAEAASRRTLATGAARAATAGSSSAPPAAPHAASPHDP
jgi:signal transduction histidine kinase